MNRTTFLLLGLIVVLGILYYFMVYRAPDASYTTGDVKITFDSAAITRFDILHAGKTITLENQGGNWMITAPGNYKVNQSNVNQLLGGMSRFKVGSLVSSNPAKQTLYQVDSAGTKLTVTDRSKKTARLIIGKPGPSYTDFYFRVDGSKDVYLGEGITPYVLNQEVRDWRDKAIFTAPQDSVTRINMDYGPKQFAFEKIIPGRWNMNGDSVAIGDVNPMLSNLSNLNAEDFIDTVPKLDLTPIHVQLQGGAKTGDLKFYPLPPDSAKYVVQSAGNPQVYTLSKWTVEQITKPVTATNEVKLAVKGKKRK